jgi:hypothetical protein
LLALLNAEKKIKIKQTLKKNIIVRKKRGFIKKVVVFHFLGITIHYYYLFWIKNGSFCDSK